MLFSILIYILTHICAHNARLSHLSEYRGHKHALCCHYLVGSSRRTSCEESVEFRGCELQRGRGRCLDISYIHDVHILAEQAAIHTAKFTHHWPRNGMLGRLRGMLTGCTVGKWYYFISPLFLTLKL